MERFTQDEIALAVRVLANSRHVKNWARAQLKFIGVDISTDEGRKKFEHTCRMQARRLIKQ